MVKTLAGLLCGSQVQFRARHSSISLSTELDMCLWLVVGGYAGAGERDQPEGIFCTLFITLSLAA